MKVMESEDRYHADRGWLDTRGHFSFDHYYDSSNMSWGAPRVFNDEIVKPPGQGALTRLAAEHCPDAGGTWCRRFERGPL